jgi:hypothetical protein
MFQGHVRVKCKGDVPPQGHEWKGSDEVSVFVGQARARHAFRSEGGEGGDDHQPYSWKKESEDDKRYAGDRQPFAWNKEFEDETQYKKLITGSGDDRHESFKKLDTKNQYTLFMSQPADMTKLPSVPEDWGEREQQAVEKIYPSYSGSRNCKEHIWCGGIGFG